MEHEDEYTDVPSEDYEEIPEVPASESMDITCTGCMARYSFDVPPNTEQYTFVCPHCNSRTTVTAQ